MPAGCRAGFCRSSRPATSPDSGMRRKRRLLDLGCGAGGCSYGYHLAGFDDITGVDIRPQPHYPFRFIQADAMSCDLSGYDLIHASMPCQAYSPLNAYNHLDYPDLVGLIRERLIETGIPYVIENVMQAPLMNPILLCGYMFDIYVNRHRGFETNWKLAQPPHPKHSRRCARNGYLPAVNENMTITGGKHSQAWQRKAREVMGTPWMATIREVCEAIPPAYTEYVGRQFLSPELEPIVTEP